MPDAPAPAPAAAPAALQPKQPQTELLSSYDTKDDKFVPEGPARLAWKRFRRHRPGMAGLVILAILYLMAIFADFLAPYHYTNEERELTWAPPTWLTFSDAKGFSIRPFIHPFRINIDENFNTVLEPDTTR